MIKNLALLDWDGTLRKGFTIKAWIAFLVKANLFDHGVEYSLWKLFDDYANNKLSHDELSQLTAELYASALKGLREIDVSLAANRFLEEDKSFLNSFSIPLFSFLKENSISMAIISGAPIEVIRVYQKMFDFDEFFALECETKNEVYSGNVKVNIGTYKEKSKVISYLASTNRYNFYMSMGNSKSDIPLFTATTINVIVDNNELTSYLSSKQQIISKKILVLEEDSDFSIISNSLIPR